MFRSPSGLKGETMNKNFVLRGLLVFFAVPAFAQEAPKARTFRLVDPKVGDSCTTRTTDQQFHKGELISVNKYTVTDVTPDGVVTFRLEILERGPQGTDPVGASSVMIQNAYGWVQTGIRERRFTPYVPVIGESART